MHELDISIYACSFGKGSSFIGEAADSMEVIVGNTALLCLTDTARAHWPCVYGTTVDLRDCLGHWSWHYFRILMGRTGVQNSTFSTFTFPLHLYRYNCTSVHFVFDSTVTICHSLLCDVVFGFLWYCYEAFKSIRLFFIYTCSNFSVPLSRTLNLLAIK